MFLRTSLILIALLAAGPSLADEISCTGAFAPDSNLQRFQDTFGKDNVVTGEVDGPEGTTMIATTVFPDDPERRFQVYWWDEDKLERLAGFTVPAKDTAPGGVRVGMTIPEVQALNGEPFTLFGFYWDYGGAASFQSGKLAELPGGCYLNLVFTPTKETDSEAISGDQELRSDLPELAAAAATVSEVNLGYPDSEAPED